MIIITTDRDLGPLSGMPFEDIRGWHLGEALMIPMAHAEDVYFWRSVKDKPALVKALKRRNAPLVVPEWLTYRKEVDT